VSIEWSSRSRPADAADPVSGRRHIWLCADDYGISTAVNVAIRDLVVRGHLNATSVMVVAPSFHRSEALSLNVLNAGMPRVAIGLHVTLTAPFRPLSKGYKPTRDGAFLPLGATLARAMLHGLHRDAIMNEIAAQLRLFVHTFGRPPDFIDGHQHVQLFPQVRDALLTVASQSAPAAWVRQCGRVAPLSQRLRDRKALLLDVLSHGFRQRATALGVRTNPGFAGTYEFNERANFAALFTRFLDHLPNGSVVMCHPGFVDAELQRLDPLTTLREREYAFLADEGFPSLLAAHGVVLA
jgi:chitin disaccharide deacetylase